MKKLGKKELILQLSLPLQCMPPALDIPGLTLSPDKFELTYTFDSNSEQISIADLLQKLTEQGITFKDLHTKQSSLEEIFVSLVSSGVNTNEA